MAALSSLPLVAFAAWHCGRVRHSSWSAAVLRSFAAAFHQAASGGGPDLHHWSASPRPFGGLHPVFQRAQRGAAFIHDSGGRGPCTAYGYLPYLYCFNHFRVRPTATPTDSKQSCCPFDIS